MRRKIEFDDSRARTYRKVVEVLAFQSDDPVLFDKSWGKQEVRASGWVIVPLTEKGEPTNDLYGCDAEEFAQTYEPSPSLRLNRYREKELVRAYQPGDPFETDAILQDGHIEVKGSGADSYDAWVVKAPGREVYPVKDNVFRRTYREVTAQVKGYPIKTCDEHWQSDGSPKRILTLDGGGVRGILTLGYLERIEEILRNRHGNDKDFRLSHYFDLIAGTSTGAIIAACLVKGMAVSEIIEHYMMSSSKVFKRSIMRQGFTRAKYSTKALNKSLKSVHEENTSGSYSLKTGLLVVAKDLEIGEVLALTNNPSEPNYRRKLDDNFLSKREDHLIRLALRASSAAPFYFEPALTIIDGGASPHNNPSLFALQYVALRGFGLNWLLDPDKLLLVSLGTGASLPGKPISYYPFIHAIKSLLSLMDDCAVLIENIMQWLSNSPTARLIDSAIGDLGSDLLAERPLFEYLRYNVQFTPEWLKDNLGMEVGASDIKQLGKMDNPDIMPLLKEISIKAAKTQIQERHFPSGFDLT